MAVVVSAPGKVLVTGAYLVLEQPNAGIVLSTSARFFAIVKPLRSTLDPDSWAWSWADVKLLSPQLSKETIYKLSLRNFAICKVSPTSENGSPFVEHALELATATAKLLCQDDEGKRESFQKLLLHGLEITILGSNDFYSYRKLIEAKGLPLQRETLASLPPFSSISLNVIKDGEESVPEVSKTGLGSSAAMTTAVVASVLQYLGALKLPTWESSSSCQWQNSTDLDFVHVVSQVAHSLAQGKIGSGFDISSAVYGSQRYVRFSPSILNLAQANIKPESSFEFAKKILDAKWDGERCEYSLPPLFTLIVGEPGSGGSHTPSMVKSVQKWRKEDSDKTSILWSELAQANKDVEKGLLDLKRIAQEHAEIYKNVIQSCCSLPASKWINAEVNNEKSKVVVDALLETRQAFLRVRSLLRTIGEGANVPIEPKSQEVLLDATMDVEGVVFAGVPGAGGYDAVFAITLDTSAADCVRRLWSSKGVLAMCVTEDPRGVSLEKGDPRQTDLTTHINALTLD